MRYFFLQFGALTSPFQQTKTLYLSTYDLPALIALTLLILPRTSRGEVKLFVLGSKRLVITTNLLDHDITIRPPHVYNWMKGNTTWKLEVATRTITPKYSHNTGFVNRIKQVFERIKLLSMLLLMIIFSLTAFNPKSIILITYLKSFNNYHK